MPAVAEPIDLSLSVSKIDAEQAYADEASNHRVDILLPRSRMGQIRSAIMEKAKIDG